MALKALGVIPAHVRVVLGLEPFPTTQKDCVLLNKAILWFCFSNVQTEKVLLNISRIKKPLWNDFLEEYQQK